MNQLLPPEVPADDQTPSADNSFGDILNQFEQEQRGEAAGPIKGQVISIEADRAVLDIGRKTEGIVPLDRLKDAKGQVLVKPGDTLQVTVTGRSEDGYYTLSTLKIEQPKDWSALEQAFAEKKTITGTVQEVVKGGLRVDIGVRAFMPASRSGARDIPEMEKLVGQDIECRITKLDTASEDVVVDRRVVLEEQERQRKDQAFSALSEGDVVEGKVRSLTDFGAFVDLGGVDGLLHVSDMSWTRIAKPADVLKAGDTVQVKILRINRETRKVSLGMKQLVPDPWTLAAEKYKPGDRVRGTVARLADFGAFVELEPGVEGLIHLTEMSWSKKVRKPSDVVQAGEQVEVQVLGVNPTEKRIALGLKQALGDPWEDLPNRFPVGSVVEGPVTNLADFGAFIEMAEGIEGMIHIADITREKRLNHPREALSKGQVVKAQVLEIDRERRRIRLGMKQLEPTSTDTFIAEHQPGDVVSGRLIDVSNGRARVELGEGVVAVCRLAQESQPQQAPAAENRSKVDVSTATALLASKWKQGGGPSTPSKPEKDQLRAGQVRNFRIAALDPAQKRIEIELAQ